MQLSFPNEEAKEEFLKSLDKVKKSLSRRSLRQLDNLELLQKVLDMVDEDETDDATPSTSVEDAGLKLSMKPMLENSGKRIYVCLVLT